MEDKILDRINSLTSQINELASKREDLIKNLRRTDHDMETLSMLIFELKNLLEKDDDAGLN